MVDEVPPLEQRILRVIAAAEDAGGTDDLARLHADDELAQFDRDRVTRTLVRLKDDGYVDGNLIEVDQSDLPVKAVGLRLTQRGLRAIDVWPREESLGALLKALDERAAAADSPEKRTALQRIRDSVGRLSSEALTAVIRAWSTYAGGPGSPFLG